MGGEDFRGYRPHHYAGWANVPDPIVVRTRLSSDELLQVSSLLDALDESGAQFTGTVNFNGRSFPVAFNGPSEEHYITIS
jgi:hypothetical protein